MLNIKWRFICLIIGMIGFCGCAYESLTYRTVTDGLDKKEYLIVGRVTDSGDRPVQHCSVFLTRGSGEMEPVFIGVTDSSGTYHAKFELKGATEFWLHFDARDQGYPIRYESFSHLLASPLFQYTGNNPVIVNVVMDRQPSVQSAS